MPSPAAKLGPQAYPIPPGNTDSALADPVLDGLLNFANIFLSGDLNPKFANLNGTPGVAVLPGALHRWNPLGRPNAMFLRSRQDGPETSGLPAWAPDTVFAEDSLATIGVTTPGTGNLILCTQGGRTGAAPGPTGATNAMVDGSAVWAFIGPVANGVPRVPGLWCWRESSVMKSWSTLMDYRLSTIKLAWIWNQLLLPGGWEDRYGVFGAVEGSFQRAFSLEHHPDHFADAALDVVLGLCGMGVDFQGSAPMLIGPVPVPGGAQDQPAVRGFPAIVCTLQVSEGIGMPTPLPSEQPMDLQTGLNIVDDSDPRGPLHVLDAVVPAGPTEKDT